MMKWAVCRVALMLPAAALAQQPEGKVRAKLEAAEKIWTGQKVELDVELFAPGYFSGTPTFDLPRLPGVLMLPPAGSPVISSETDGDVAYTVQRHEILIYPQKDGAISIPPFEIRFNYKRQPLDPDSVSQTVKTGPISLQVTRPPGAPAGVTILTSTDLSVEETWSPEPGAHAKVGDAFVRTLTWSAGDLSGMAFPPFKPAAIPGLGIYPREPQVNDTSERGDLRGQRTDTVTYVVKSGGRFEIPAVTIQWWDPKAGALKSKILPGHSFDAPQPPAPPVPLTTRIAIFWRLHGSTIVLGLAGAAALAIAGRISWPLWRRLWRNLQPNHLGPLNPP